MPRWTAKIKKNGHIEAKYIPDYKKEFEEAKKQLDHLSKTNSLLNKSRMSMYESLRLERAELVTRIQRIDNRIGAIGFDAPVLVNTRNSEGILHIAVWGPKAE